MSEHEKRLREWVHEHARSKAAETTSTALIDAALSLARAEALEEAERACQAVANEAQKRAEAMGTAAIGHEDDRTMETAADLCAERIRALITTPAPASIPTEKVREVLCKAREAWAGRGGRRVLLDNIARALCVGLDAAPTCRVCGAQEGQPHKMICRTTEREAATEENGLLPASFCKQCKQRHPAVVACQTERAE